MPFLLVFLCLQSNTAIQTLGEEDEAGAEAGAE